MEIHTRHTTQKIMPFRPLWCESEAISSEKVRFGFLRWSVYMGKFSSQLRDLSRKTRDLGNQASPPAFHTNTSQFLARKEWQGEISKTEPVRLNRAHMKRLLDRKRKYI